MKRFFSSFLTFSVLTVVALTVISKANISAQEIKHKFIALGESRNQILLINENQPEQNQNIPLDDKARGLELINTQNGALTVLTGLFNGGYLEIDCNHPEHRKFVLDSRWAGNTVTAIRLTDGNTLLGVDAPTTVFYLLDSNGNELKKFDFPDKHAIRSISQTSEGTILFGCNKNHLIEMDLEGKILRDQVIPEAEYIYHAIERSNGNRLVSCGFGASVLELNRDGEIVKRWGKTDKHPEELGLCFFASVQELENGHIVVCNWTGHEPNDSEKGVQIIEFDQDNNIVWTWHNAQLAGTLHHVLILE